MSVGRGLGVDFGKTSDVSGGGKESRPVRSLLAHQGQGDPAMCSVSEAGRAAYRWLGFESQVLRDLAVSSSASAHSLGEGRLSGTECPSSKHLVNSDLSLSSNDSHRMRSLGRDSSGTTRD